MCESLLTRMRLKLLIALAEQGVGILVISSEFAELRVLCDRFLVMSGGVVVADLAAEEAGEERLLAIASGLGDPLKISGQGADNPPSAV
jgi:ABC-type sugar transport system ATPase subunit